MSLPKGPGSIEGLASADFSPSISTGSASYAIDIAVPPASAGFGPSLSLAYDSGNGVTEIGIGWRVAGVPKIRRRTQNGLPRFDATDPFEIVGVGIPSDLLEVSERMYRPAYEDGSFVRVERTADGEEWEARTKAGVTFRFGGAGFVEAEGTHTSAYLLREEADRHGHTIEYEWDTHEGHALLTHVTWNAFDASSKNELRFDYEGRPDSHTLFSTGILETLSRRLHAVEVDHGGSLVRRYELAYGDGAHPVLGSIQLVGRDGTSRMPASTFDYTASDLGGATATTMANAPGQSPADPDVTLADLDGDGLPDLLVGKAGQFRSYLNRDGKSWFSPADWGSASPSVSLSQTGVQLADVDGDGAVDLLVKSGTDDFRYFPRVGSTSFGASVPIRTVPSFSFEDADVQLGDMDGDRRVDVVITTEAGIAVGYDLGGSDWTEPDLVGPVDPTTSVRFSDGQTSLCDVNGDRVLDVCSLHSGGMTYWLGRGRGHFQAGVSAVGVPSFDSSAPFQLADVNGDGWVDLLRVEPSSVSVALAAAEGVFGDVRTIDGTPPRTRDTRIDLADMNGSGTTDIVWIDVSADSSVAWRYLDLFPSGRAGLIRRIDNGLGKVQSIDYEPAALQAAQARDAGAPWSTRIDVAMPVVARVTEELSLGDPSTVTEFTYRDGTYDPNERTFAGFGGGTRRQIGDASTPTLLADSTVDTGLIHRELRGAPLDERAYDGSGSVFTHTAHAYTSRVVGMALDGRSVGYSFESSTRIDHVEGGIAPGRTTLTEYDQDDFGDVVEERRWGEISGDDLLVGNDEAIVTRTFANDANEWLLGYVATEELTDATGRRTSSSRKYYDGAPFVGLPLGQVARGDVSHEEAWVGPGPDDFELVMATSYDSDGLPVETKDGRGGGRFFEWAADHTSIQSERVKLESNALLVERADVDSAFGTLLGATDYAGQTTSYEYDAFGRLTKVVKPGDSSEFPTVQYGYQVMAPLSRVVTESRVESGEQGVERSETLIDGAGRERGTLTRDGTQWIFAGVSLFDARGEAKRALLPRAVDEAGYGSPPLLDATPPGTDLYRDALGREVGTRSPSGIETRTEYAPFEKRHWDGGQNDPSSPYEHTPTVERTDGLGRVVAHERTLDGALLSSTYTYDPRGGLTSRTDTEGHTSRYDYDGRGRRTAVHDPDLGDHAFSFDATGNVVSRLYPDGVTAHFTFDLAGRSLTEDWDSDGVPEMSRTWDIGPSGADPLYLGKLARVDEPTGSVEHTYDARGRVTRTTYDIEGATYAVGSEYDAQDREILHVYPDGSSIAIRRNPRGQIAGYGHAVDIEYGDDGLEKTRTFNTGVAATSSYDLERRRSELVFAGPTGSVIEHLKWTYDGGGNLTRLADMRPHVTPDDDRSETYAYDNLYRLVGSAGAWGNTAYGYSSSGNFLRRISTVASQAISAVAYAERPHAPVAFDGRKLAYDARGRVTSDGSRSYTWNDADQLIAVSRSDGSSEENGYGDDGVRRLRVEHGPDGSSTTTHFIDAWSEATDGKLVRYIVHAGQRIVKLDDRNGTGASAAFAGSARGTVRRSDARAASAPGIGIYCLFAFALTAALRILRKFRRFDLRAALVPAVRAAAAGAGLALVCTSAAPAPTAIALCLLAALSLARNVRVRRVARLLVVSMGVLFAATACGGGDAKTPALEPRGSVQELSAADTLIATDLLGSVLGETSGTGAPVSAFAAYPFGAARYDSSHATWKFAATPRDGGVGLDHMGARFYAPDLGIFTSGDPVALTNPERLVTAEFAAANPYAYAKQSPVVAADRDGHFFQIIAGAFFGAAIGGGIEAARQYIAHGKVEDWGRVGAAAAGGAVSGAICAANPAVGIAQVMGVGAASNAASGITERLVASGGKSAGSLSDVAIDAAVGAATAGVAHGATTALKSVAAGAEGAAQTLERSTGLARDAFSRGGSHLTTTASIAKFAESSTLGAPSGLFVAPSGDIDALLERSVTRGDLEAALGLEHGHLGNGMLVRVDIPNASSRNLRLPEAGNQFFRPGTGLTTGNIPEALVDSPLKTDASISYNIVGGW